MRWFLGITKILVAVLLLAAVIKLAYTFQPFFKSINSAYERVKEFGISGPTTKTQERDNSESSDNPDSSGGDNGNSGTENTETENADDNTGNETNAVKPGDYYMTGREVDSLEKISLADKLTGLSIIGKLKKADIDRIMKISEDGVTYDEMEQIKQILEKDLNHEDMEKLNGILLKNRTLYADGRPDN